MNREINLPAGASSQAQKAGLSMGPGVAIAAILAAAMLPWLTDSAFHLHLGILILLNAMMVLGFGLVASVGQLSLCHAALAGFGGYLSAVLAMRWGVPPILGIVLAAGGAAIIAWLLGMVILRLRGVYFVLVTFLVGQAFTLIALNLDAITQGANGMVGVPAISVFGKVLSSRGDYYYFALGAFAVVLLAVWMLMRSTIGRSFKSVAENIRLAEACGMNTRRLQLIAFTVGSAIAGFTGAILTHYTRFISPDSFTFYESVIYITMYVIGGRNRISGAVLGAALLTPLPELLRNFVGYQQIIYGTVLVSVLIFLPGGLASLFDRFRRLRNLSQGGQR